MKIRLARVRLLVGNDGRVRVADFGIASTIEAAAEELATTGDIESPLRTRAGELAGTPAYMAPEQFAGEPVDARADQFALCVALYEAVCGARPFAGGSLSSLRHSVLSGAVRPPPRWLPAALRSLLLRGLARAPERRFPDMAALIGALERLLRPRVVRWSLAAVGVAAASAAALASAGTGPTGQVPQGMSSETGGPTLAARLWAAAPAVCVPRLPFTGDRAALQAAAAPITARMKQHPASSAAHLDARLELIGLMLSAGDRMMCKVAARTRAGLDADRAFKLECLERQFCGVPVVTCPADMHSKGPNGCEPVAECGASGAEAQRTACLAGEARCCASAMIVREYEDLEAGVAGGEPSRAYRRALAEAGCERGYAWVCAEGALLGGQDPKAMRDRACSLGHAASCAAPEAK